MEGSILTDIRFAISEVLRADLDSQPLIYRPVARYLLLKNPQLLNFVIYRPHKDSLNTGGFIRREFFRADLQRADEKPLAELIDGPIQQRRERSDKTRSASDLFSVMYMNIVASAFGKHAGSLPKILSRSRSFAKAAAN
jgi:hypothetical protein